MKAFKVILIFTLLGQGLTVLFQNYLLPDVDIFMFDRMNAEASSISCDVLICENADLCFEKVGDDYFEVHLSMN